MYRITYLSFLKQLVDICIIIIIMTCLRITMLIAHSTYTYVVVNKGTVRLVDEMTTVVTVAAQPVVG